MNNFRHSIRALKRQKSYMLINIIGLSIGIACSLIISLFIFNELSYDRFNEKKDRIYRLIVNGVVGGREVSYAAAAAPWGPTMLAEFPEVEDFNRMLIVPEIIVKTPEKTFIEHGYINSDSSFFDIFSIPLLRGNKKTVLNTSHALVLAESTAKRIFGADDPMDKTLLIGGDTIPYRVTGIMGDVPETSHFNATMIGSFMSLNWTNDNNWGNSSFVTYILLKPNTKPDYVNAKTPELIRKYMGPLIQEAYGISVDEFMTSSKFRIYLQPLNDIHLNPAITQNTKPSGNPKYLYIFSSVALLIITIAAVNFMNLSTAQASTRAKEVGIKKVSGSSKGMLIRQFLAETLLLSFLSLVLAVIIVENSLPFFNNLLAMKLQMNLFTNWFTIPLLIVLSIFIGLLAGSYPAFYLSSFNPYLVLKGKLRDSIRHGRFRSILVVIQFSISIILIVGTIIMVRQIRFMLHKDLGFNKEQLLVISNAGAIGNHVNAFKDAIAKIPEVLKSTSSTAVPGNSLSGQTYVIEGQDGEVIDMRINYVDYDFFDTYGIALSSGRTFNESFGTDKDAGVVNESAAKQFKSANPLATMLVSGDKKQNIIGIAKNFHFETLRNEITPYIFKLKNEYTNYGYISIRLSTEATVNTIKSIEEVWKNFVSSDPIQYFFLDQDFAQKYKEEQQNAQLSLLFSILAIIIASLGLFGLTSFTIEQRTKEIGLRKIMGASMISIFRLISKELILLISVSALISWPLIYFIARNWLQNFYYRTNLKLFDFLAGFIVVMIIAIITISYRTIKTARINPVEALRYE